MNISFATNTIVFGQIDLCYSIDEATGIDNRAVANTSVLRKGMHQRFIDITVQGFMRRKNRRSGLLALTSTNCARRSATRAWRSATRAWRWITRAWRLVF